MKRLKFLIIIVILIIIITTALLILVLTNKQELSDELLVEKEDPANAIVENSNVEIVQEMYEYYGIQKNVEKFFSYINVEIKDETAIKSLLDQECLDNIQIQKVFEDYNCNSYDIKDMYVQRKTVRKDIYFIEILLDYKRPISIIMKTDTILDAFSIIPNEYILKNNITKETISNFDIDVIEQNLYNSFIFMDITDEQAGKLYMKDYIDTCIYNPEQAYKMLESTYKQERFPNYEIFETYIENMEDYFKNIQIVSVSKKDNKYIITDSYTHEYVIEENYPMNYRIALDNNTISYGKVNEKYSKMSSKEKVEFNIDRFFELINIADYEKAYEKLDETFKQNNYPTLQEFQNYLKQNLYKYNNIKIKQYEDVLTNVYIYKVSLNNEIQGQREYKVLKIAIQLLNEMDYKLSFVID